MRPALLGLGAAFLTAAASTASSASCSKGTMAGVIRCLARCGTMGFQNRLLGTAKGWGTEIFPARGGRRGKLRLKASYECFRLACS